MTQQRYEAKKALLKRVREQWRVRLVNDRSGPWLPGYLAAQDRLNRFIRRSQA